MRRPGVLRGRGSVLLLALLFMFILFLMAVALFQMIPTELHSAHRSRNDLMGHYVADAGVKNAVAWLEERMDAFQASQDYDDLPDEQLDAWNSAHDGAGDPDCVINGDWGWWATIAPDTLINGSNPNFAPRVYHITSTARLRDRDYRSVQVSVKQASFAGYAMFIDRWPTDGTVWSLGEGGVNGPVHTNDFLVLMAPNASYWTKTDARAYFWGARSEVTFSTRFGEEGGDGLAYLNGNAVPNFTGLPTAKSYDDTDFSMVPYTKEGGTDRYYRMLEKGRESLKIKKNIELPSASSELSNRAWDSRDPGDGGDTKDKPTEQGVFLKADGKNKLVGGVYVNGTTEIMDMRLDKTGNQEIRVTQKVPVNEESPVYTWVLEPYSPPQYKDEPIYETQYVKQTVSEPIWEKQTYTVMEPIYEYQKVGTEKQPIYEEQTVYEDVGGIIKPVKKLVIVGYKDVDKYAWVKVGEKAVTKTKWVITGYKTVEKTVPKSVQVGTKKVEQFQWVKKKTGTTTSVVMKNVTTKVFEATEAPVTVTDKTGTAVTAAKGETMLVQPDNTVKVFSGQPNGTLFNNGDIENLRGIVKGNAYDKDTDGNWKYRNKTLAVDIAQGQSVDVGDDLLQYDAEAFKSVSSSEKNKFGTSTYDDSDKWLITALNSNQTSAGKWDPETSPDSHHAFGIIAQDVFIKGEQNTSNPIDVYGVILAGRSIVDGDGKQIDSKGGFGTHPSLINNGKKGKFRIIGGVIQAKPYTWYAGGGYVGDLWYDDEASKQEIFPTYARFTTLRYVEVPARPI